MWSIGAITTTLLSGQSVFCDQFGPLYGQNPRAAILKLSSKCDLSFLDKADSVWNKVGARPKDFVKRLLVLQEVQRMTVTEALAHSWFTNKYHATEFDALYERATVDWKPHRKTFQLVEFIPESPEIAIPSWPKELLSQECVSRYFKQPANRRRQPSKDVGVRLQVSAYPNNTPLPSISEDAGSWRSEGSSQLSALPQSVNYLDASSSRDSLHGPITSPMNHISVERPGSNEYLSKKGEDVNENQHTRSGDELDNGVIPNVRKEPDEGTLQPHTPDDEPESSLVQETPVGSFLRHQYPSSFGAQLVHESIHGNANTQGPYKCRRCEESPQADVTSSVLAKDIIHGSKKRKWHI